MFEFFDVLGPATVAGLMVALTHAPLGIEVLKRGIIFIDLAVAQLAGLGLVLVNTVVHTESPWLAQVGALAFALGGSMFFRFVEKRAPDKQEAIIGCTFILAASLSVLLLAGQPHGGEEIQHLLSGQLLFVKWSDVLVHFPIYLIILLLWCAMPRCRTGVFFYFIFATAITSSVQLCGVYLVFASLILPALAASGNLYPMLTAWLCGIVAVIVGLILAWNMDTPAGPTLVVSYCACGWLLSRFSFATAKPSE